MAMRESSVTPDSLDTTERARVASTIERISGEREIQTEAKARAGRGIWGICTSGNTVDVILPSSLPNLYQRIDGNRTRRASDGIHESRARRDAKKITVKTSSLN